MANKILLVVFVAFVVAQVISKPVAKKNEDTKLELHSSETLKFLTSFGYLKENSAKSSALLSEDTITDAIKNVQRYGNLPQTGRLDNATVTLMRSPRCGTKDIVQKRNKRFTIIGNPWGKKAITFFIASWVETLGRDVVAQNIQKALDIWGQYGGLKFQEVFHENADIVVSFGSGEHGDGDPFDGPGRTLAHAYPTISRFGYGIEGDIHFDADENWTTRRGVRGALNFFDVALHELGHTLGLGHSEVTSAVMYPYFRGQSNTLDRDDIQGMKHLYGNFHDAPKRPTTGNHLPPPSKKPTRKPTYKPAYKPTYKPIQPIQPIQPNYVPTYQPIQPIQPVYQPVWILGKK